MSTTTISTQTTTAIVLNSGTVAPNLSVTSTGGITTFGNAVAANSIATVTNAGTVVGSTGGIDLSNGGLVVNTPVSAEIEGLQFDGVAITGAAGTVVNAGDIYGNIHGVFLAAGGAVINSGSINGIYNAAGSFTLTVAPGAESGDVTDNAGNGDLILAGTTASTLDLDNFSGFTSISFAAGADWTLTGQSGELANGETITGFVIGDEIILQGNVATSASYIAGTGVSLSNGAVLNINLPADTGFYTTTDGTNTTIQALINTVSTAIATDVVLNAGTYAPNLSVTTTGAVNAAGNAILANSLATVTNSGTVIGSNGGIQFNAGGSFINNANADIQGGMFDGVAVDGAPGTIVNAGTITGVLHGVFLADGGAVIDSGTINGIYNAAGSFALTADPGAVFTGGVSDNAGTGDLILAGTTASALNISSFSGFSSIAFAAGSDWTLTGNDAELDAGQTISGFTIGDEIVLQGHAATSDTYIPGTGLRLSTGQVLKINHPADTGFYTTTDGTNTTIQLLINTVSTSLATDVVLNVGTYAPNLSITTAGSINAAGNAILANDLATVTNSGTVIGANGGIQFDNGGSFINNANADIQGGMFDGVAVDGAPGTIVNAGTITGVLHGVFLAAGGAVIDSGTINGIYNAAGSFALTADPGAVFTGGVSDNAGTGDLILAGTTAGALNISSFSGFSSIGFAAGSDWTLTGNDAELDAGQTISGFTIGDEIVLQGHAATSNSYIPGTGLRLSTGQVLKINHPADTGFYTTTDGTNTTIQLLINTISTSVNRALVLNRGTYASNISVTTAGTINSHGDGIDASAAATVTNAGVIFGTLGQGISLGASGTVTNTGTIGGGVYGVDLTDGGAVTNSGTIGGGTDALYNKAGNLALTVDPGADFIGDVVDHAGNGDLILGGTVASSLNLNTFFGFTSLAIASGAHWTLGGTDADLSSGQTITGFSLGDEIVLAGSAATAGTFVPGIGLELNNGQTLNVNAPPADAVFYITSNGTSTTVQELIGTISARNGAVTLGNGTYTPNISVTAAGTVTGGSTGILANAAATVTNAGTVAGVTGVTLDDGGDINNTGTQSYIDGTGGFGLDLLNAPATVVNAGTITGIPDGVYLQDGGVVTNSGTITGMPDAIYNKAGSFTLNVMPGAVFGGESVDHAGNGTLNLGGTTASTLNLNTFIGFNPLNFGTGAAWTVDTSPTRIAGETIGGFDHTDTIDISPLSLTTASLLTLGANGELAIGTLDLEFTGLAAGKEFTLVSDGHGGENLELVACFCPGTRISTPDGYTLVENLQIGDLVTTASAGAQKIKWIGRRSYAAPFCNNTRTLPIRIARHALGKNLPSRALHLSPGHALAIDGQLVHAGRLVNGASITQKPRAKLVEYYHIELETHEVIFAENLPVETFMDEDFRNQFANAATFAALYPGARAPQAPCLPTLRDGFDLFAIQRRIARHAGVETPLHSTGPLQGCVDEAGPVVVRGWAQDVLAPEHPVSLIVMAGGVYAGQVLANAYRPDLLKAGLGSGHHGFEYVLPAGVTGPITLHRTADGTPLMQPVAATKAA